MMVDAWNKSTFYSRFFSSSLRLTVKKVKELVECLFYGINWVGIRKNNLWLLKNWIISSAWIKVSVKTNKIVKHFVVCLWWFFMAPYGNSLSPVWNEKNGQEDKKYENIIMKMIFYIQIISQRIFLFIKNIFQVLTFYLF